MNPIRFLLRVAATCVALPIAFPDQLLNVYAFPILMFYAGYFSLLNIPRVGMMLQSKPTYVDDLTIVQNGAVDESFKKVYAVLMNLILALMLASAAEYVVLKGITEKPLIEIVGMVGGVLSIYVKVQNSAGKVLLFVFARCKNKEVHRRRRASSVEAQSDL